ncbi:hypothetical protein PHJA_002377300 [Phtheirospermum japonicum]|uniref:Uncharacterized protein n=1 Tax=Phtheirospermum japonicum TaxID=374723 RepID=A0A830CVR2_9LAMI|nr:hypothetical protein PHJA_002377300 [Phtheirospermum japonicum]
MGSYGMLARRDLLTNTPIMVEIQELVRGLKDCVSLAHGGSECDDMIFATYSTCGSSVNGLYTPKLNNSGTKHNHQKQANKKLQERQIIPKTSEIKNRSSLSHHNIR